MNGDAMDLPVLLLERVFSFVHPRDLGLISCLSTRWRDFSADDRSWHRILSRHFGENYASGTRLPPKDLYFLREGWKCGIKRSKSYDVSTALQEDFPGYFVRLFDGWVLDRTFKIKLSNGLVESERSSSLCRDAVRGNVCVGYSTCGIRVAEKGNWQRYYDVGGMAGSTCVDFGKFDGENSVACGFYDGCVQIWRLDEENRMGVLLVGLMCPNPVTGVIFLENGVLATRSTENEASIWDIASAKCLWRINQCVLFFEVVRGSLLTVGKVEIGEKLSVGAQLWDQQNGGLQRTITLENRWSDWFYGEDYAAVDVVLVRMAREDYDIQIWDLEVGACVRVVPLMDRPNSLDFDGERIVCGYDGGIMVLERGSVSHGSIPQEKPPLIGKEQHA
ncbi:hypothetical protein BSKO_05993 [Bryopsis sp. KO-2023]|nr:hypothetical protein BSKO_05993 [Bryopsis sp. KO-2023]